MRDREAYDPQGLWWEQKPGPEMAGAMVSQLLNIRDLDDNAGSTSRRDRLAEQRAIYLDRQGPVRDDEAKKGRSPYPALMGAVRSVHEKIVTSRPRPRVISVSGRFKEQRKARLLQRWIDGFYEERDCYDLLSDLVEDAQVYDIAAIKVYSANGQIALDRTWDGDLFVDPYEERFGPPRVLYHVAAIDRDKAKARFPEHEEAIMAAPAASPDDVWPFSDLELASAYSRIDKIVMIESWRLGAYGDPGQHAACIEGATLLHEAWDRPGFPFVTMIWARDPERWRGQGMVEQGSGMQMDLDEHEDIVKEAMRSFVPRWAVPANCQVSTKDLGDEIVVIEYTGQQPPTVLAPAAVNPQFLDRTVDLSGRVFTVTGASEMEAASVTPAGLESGRAIMAHQDATSIRFLTPSRNYEQASVKLAQLIIEEADLLASTEGAALEVYGEDGEELYDYRSVKMKPGSYRLRVYPASKLPDTVAGRLEIVSKMRADGVLTDVQEYRRMMDVPDLERNEDLTTAKRRYADKMIDRCLDGDVGQPTEEMDLEYAINRAQIELCDALARDGEEDDPDAMEMLRSFIGATQMLLSQAAQAQMPAPGAPPPPEAPMGAEQPGLPQAMPEPAMGGEMLQ